MGLRFFHRFPIIGRFVTLNLSKTGVSASVGIPGFHVTHGTHGTRVTAGIPGTGLFYTEQLNAALLRPAMAGVPIKNISKLRDLAAGYVAVAQQPQPTADDLVAAVNRQKTFGLSDADLTPPLLEAREAIFSVLQAQYGYRVERPVAPAPVAQPRTSWTGVVVLVGIVLAIFVVFSLLAWRG